MYPEGLTEHEALKMLLGSIEKLQHEMGGTDASKGCTGLIKEWDSDHPTIHYLERNMAFARVVIERENVAESVLA